MVGESPCRIRAVHLRNVIGEASIGDAELARQRLKIAKELSLLAVTEEAEGLAPLLLKAAGLASNAETDALHMAVAAVHGMDYLLSWNCTHIANATIRPPLSDSAGRRGLNRL